MYPAELPMVRRRLRKKRMEGYPRSLADKERWGLGTAATVIWLCG